MDQSDSLWFAHGIFRSSALAERLASGVYFGQGGAIMKAFDPLPSLGESYTSLCEAYDAILAATLRLPETDILKTQQDKEMAWKLS